MMYCSYTLIAKLLIIKLKGRKFQKSRLINYSELSKNWNILSNVNIKKS